jgi:hypothetical protein
MPVSNQFFSEADLARYLPHVVRCTGGRMFVPGRTLIQPGPDVLSKFAVTAAGINWEVLVGVLSDRGLVTYKYSERKDPCMIILRIKDEKMRLTIDGEESMSAELRAQLLQLYKDTDPESS